MSNDAMLQKVANTISGIDSLFDMRRPLERAGFKVDAFNGDTGYVLMVKPKRGSGKTIAITSSNLADDADLVIGKYAIGYLGEATDEAMVEADGESGQRIIKKYSEVIAHDSEDDDSELYSKGSDLEDEESMEPDEYDVEDNITAVDKAVEYMQNHGAVEPSNYPQYSKDTWYRTIDGDQDYRTGETTYYSFHLQGFSPEEEQEIYDRISGKKSKIKERRMHGRLLPKKGTPQFRQFKIAVDTIRNPQKGMFMGGPSEEEAIQMLKDDFGLTDKDIQKIRDMVSITEPVAEAEQGTSKFASMTPAEAAKYAFGTNVFPPEFIEVWDVKSGSSSKRDRVDAEVARLKQDGYTIKFKTYSDFWSWTGVKRKTSESIKEMRSIFTKNMQRLNEVGHRRLNF